MSETNRIPMVRALALADQELKDPDSLSPDEVEWLMTHPITWLKALGSMKAQVESHINKARTSIESLKPAPGSTATGEYVRAKQAVERANLPRFHFLQKTVERMAEVKTLIGHDHSYYANDAEMVDRIINAVRLIREGQIDQAVESLNALLASIEELHNT